MAADKTNGGTPTPPTTAKQNDEEKAAKILENADQSLQAVDGAFVFTTKSSRDFPKFQFQEITRGSLLGKGGFSGVHEVESIRLLDHEESSPGAPAVLDESPDTTKDEEHYDVNTARTFMSKRYLRFGSPRYAIKKLKPELGVVDRARGAVDLAIEIKFLSAIWHPNIIKMRGYSDLPRVHEETFLLLDRLYGTLEEKMENWAQEHAMNQSCCGNSASSTNNTEAKNLMTERLLICYDLSSAFNYMHGLRLLYRDIKPENIGFDVRGDVKVFDFGLCKSLEPKDKNKEYGYNLSARTGSIPYMAPEVALGKPYDQKADVFSFSILLWEVMSMAWAFNGYDARRYFIDVCAHHQRLPIPQRPWPAIVRTIVQEGWDKEAKKRPTMKRIGTLLRAELEDRTTDDAVLNRTQHMMNKSRRSQRGHKLAMDASRSRRSSQVFVGGDICGVDNDDSGEIKAPTTKQ